MGMEPQHTSTCRAGTRARGASADSGETPRWQRVPALPLALTLLLLGFALLAPVRGNPRLVWTFLGVGGALLAWTAILWIGVRRWGQSFRIELVRPLKSHYIQGSVQICLYAYWGWYWREVYSHVPLILAQLVFLYVFDALLTWSRGRAWRLGCGPLPIILSANVFIWFRDDWFVFQFLLVAVGSLGKEFIQWNRDGRRTHIFNPSAFTLALFSIVLIATGTSEYTWAGSIAATVSTPPHIYLVVFLLGLVVQYFFSVTLMTLSAAAVLCLLNLAYMWSTGTYYFVFSNIPAPVFLGLHLLMTDPSTSPRSNAGKIVFGALYGLGVFAMFGIFHRLDGPTIYDKLLPVPLLNLSVRAIDRWSRVGILAAFSRWEAAFQPRVLNLVHMGCWGALFTAMMATGYVEAPHEGNSVRFWKEAAEQGSPSGSRGLVEVLKNYGRLGSSDAWNELGVIHLKGELVEKDRDAAARYFARASRAGHLSASVNLVGMFFSAQGGAAQADALAALDRLEQECGEGAPARLLYLVGRAYETGQGRPQDPARARALYERACGGGSADACAGLERLP